MSVYCDQRVQILLLVDYVPFAQEADQDGADMSNEQQMPQSGDRVPGAGSQEGITGAK